MLLVIRQIFYRKRLSGQNFDDKLLSHPFPTPHIQAHINWIEYFLFVGR